MTSLISSYHTGSMDTSAECTTQNKLNACVLSLQNLVEEWKPDETNQGYIDYTLEPTIYYFGYTKDIKNKPAEETPVICNIGSLSVQIGKIDTKGIFITTLKNETKENISQYIYVSVQTEDYKGTVVPTPSSTHIDIPYNTKEETDDNAVITENGIKELWNVTTYYNIHWVDEPGWIPGPGGEPTINRPPEGEYDPPSWGSGWFYSYSPWYVWLHVEDGICKDRYNNVCNYHGDIIQPYYPPTDPIYVNGYWAATKQTRKYYIKKTERKLDLTNWKMSFQIRLKKEK